MTDSYQIIPLKYILQNDKGAISAIGTNLEKRGYAFIRLDPTLVTELNTCVSIAEKFFVQSINYKKKFVKEPIFGYFGVNHKESFRFLTGFRLREHIIPDNFDPIRKLIKTIDQIMYLMVLLCAPVLFPNVIANAQKLKFDIPLLQEDQPWGMFDIAKYHNDGTRISLNCAEHFDPGLLSLSLRSTAPGLQLKDENNNWIAPPDDPSIGIIWAGKVAQEINPKIKLGIHRVVNPTKLPSKPRISMWYEVCISKQEHRELLSNDKPDPVKKINPVKFEDETGIPMSKSMIPRKLYDPEKSISKLYDPIKQPIPHKPSFPTNVRNFPMFKSYTPIYYRSS